MCVCKIAFRWGFGVYSGGIAFAGVEVENAALSGFTNCFSSAMTVNPRFQSATTDAGDECLKDEKIQMTFMYCVCLLYAF